MLRLGGDLGGSKTEIMALDPSGAVMLSRRELALRDDYGSLAQIGRMARDAERELGEQWAVGIGTPGAVS